MLSPKEIQKALKQSAARAQRLADAFGLKVPVITPPSTAAKLKQKPTTTA